MGYGQVACVDDLATDADRRRHPNHAPPRRGVRMTDQQFTTLRASGTAEAFDAAKAAFRENWDKWRAWAATTGFDPT